MELLDRIDAFVEQLLAWAGTVNPWYFLLAVVVFLTVETSMFVGVLVPGEAVVPLAAAVLGPDWAPLIVLATLVASLIGQSGGYWLGRGLGPRLRNSRLGDRIGARRWLAAEEIVRLGGVRALISARFVAVMHAVVPAVIGALRVPYARFIVIAGAGSLLWALAQTAIGILLGEAGRIIGFGWIALLFTAAGIVTGGFLIVRAVRRYRDGRNRSAGEQAAGEQSR